MESALSVEFQRSHDLNLVFFAARVKIATDFSYFVFISTLISYM